MAEISRAALFGKLNSVGYQSLESATTFCKLRGNPYVELIHWLHQLLQLPDSDLHWIVRHFGLDGSRLAADLTAALDQLPLGSTAISDFSGHLDDCVREAWTYATLLFGESQIRTGHLLIALAKTTGLRNVLLSMSPEFAKIKPEQLTDDFSNIVGRSCEESLSPRDGTALAAGTASASVAGGRSLAPAAMGKQEALARFASDLTEKARNHEIDPVLGRDEEIRQIIDVLMRRRQNNPILTGEAGVGKTAVVEGFAQRVASGDVPPSLADVSVYALDLGLLQAGAGVKGEFENRLRQVIEEVQSSPKPILLFIDEAHMLIGAGGSAGQSDAANLLKPALARGALRTIAATTWAEYKKYFEKDAALTRRFQVIKIDEPTEEKALLMLRGLASRLEKHHRVELLDEALEAAVRLSHRYIPARQLPDKAVGLLDTACARVAISQHAVPPAVEDTRRRIESLETELEIVERELSVGIDHHARRERTAARLESERQRLAELEEGWAVEQDLVTKILDVRAKLRAAAGREVEGVEGADEAPAEAPQRPSRLSDQEKAELTEELRTLRTQLAEHQGQAPLILPSVDEQAIASVVADWTGIPVGRMVKDEIEAVLELADRLEARVVGQRHALEAIARRVRTSRAGLDNPGRPIGVFLLVGPSGVGKTETALALAEAMYGGEDNVITISMSEFQEAHTVSTLKGAPPGYVGYGEGGVLTEAVRRRPYSVILLDEVEKAHHDVHEIFLQVFDKGRMEDGEGRLIDFKNTIILLTSNVGSELIMNMCRAPELSPKPEALGAALREPLRRVFPAALLGRLVAVPFYPINDEALRQIIRLQLSRIERRLIENQGIAFSHDEAVVDLIAARCTEIESGARMVDAILTHTLLPEISAEYMTRLMEGGAVTRAHVGTEGEEFTYRFE